MTPPFAPDRVRRILVLHQYGIGDFLCATPTLRALRRAFPGAHLAILVAGYCRALVERNPDVDEVLTYARPKHGSGGLGRLPYYGGLLRVTRDLRAKSFDLAVAIRRSFMNTIACVAYASGAPWRLGYLPTASHPFRFILNLGREPEDKQSHEVDVGLDLLASIGVLPAGREMTLVPNPQVQEAIRHRLREAGISRPALNLEPTGRVPGGGNLALVHISSRREHSRWPLPAFAQAADALQERLGLSVVLSWAPGDATNPLFPGDDGKAKDVAARMRTRPILLRTPTLPELIAAASLSDFVLSTDGGLMHIAAALDIPQVVLFGKTYTSQWAPITGKSVLLQRDMRADRIPVDDVVAASFAVMSRWGRGQAAGVPAVGVAGERAFLAPDGRRTPRGAS
jgi:ADP-heptose:LPS heptosyltransferase